MAAAAEAKPPRNLSVYCRSCDKYWYKSTRPIAEGETLKPDLFIPTSRDVPVPTEGKATCHMCQTNLMFVPDIPARPKAAQVPRPTPEALAVEALRPPAPLPPPLPQDVEPRFPPPPHVPRSAPGSVVELFRLDEGETMHEVQDFDDALLLVTSRRVVKILKG